MIMTNMRGTGTLSLSPTKSINMPALMLRFYSLNLLYFVFFKRKKMFAPTFLINVDAVQTPVFCRSWVLAFHVVVISMGYTSSVHCSHIFFFSRTILITILFCCHINPIRRWSFLVKQINQAPLCICQSISYSCCFSWNFTELNNIKAGPSYSLTKKPISFLRVS